MTPRVGEKRAIDYGSAMSRPATVVLSRLACEALAGKGEESPERAGARLTVAVRFYLRDRDSGRPAWPYPSFLRGSEVQEEVEIPLALEDELWDAFVGEAAEQGVSAQQLAEHAAFYLAAEIDAGRVTQRILDDLAEDEADAGESGSPPAR
jgi:hypothetical protein